MKKYLFMAVALAFAACKEEVDITPKDNAIERDASTIKTTIEPFDDFDENGKSLSVSRVNIAGDSFENKDMIRIRIIAPYSDNSEYDETTWGGEYDYWRLFEWTAISGNPAQTGKWGPISSSRGFDLTGDFKPNTSAGTYTMPQATPYVFTATTWTEVIHHVIPNGNSNSVVLSFSNIFKADQRRDENYKSSDVLWAQSYLQTGSEYVTFSFQHKMSALMIDISDFSTELSVNTETTEELVLTLEDMPDIDQQEVVIGNYYANKMKYRSNKFGDYYRCYCTSEENGKVLGIVYVDQNDKQLKRKPFTDNGVIYGTQIAEGVPQTGIYTAHKVADYKYTLIIPPYTVPAGVTPKLWLRKGDKRWRAELSLPADRTFNSGVRYNINMKKP